MGTCGKIFNNFIINQHIWRMLCCELNISFQNVLLRQLAFLSRAVGELVRRNLRNAPWQPFA